MFGLHNDWTVSDLHFHPAYALHWFLFELNYFLIIFRHGYQFESLIFLSYCHKCENQIAEMLTHSLCPWGETHHCPANQAHFALGTLADPHAEKMARSIQLLKFLQDFPAHYCSWSARELSRTLDTLRISGFRFVTPWRRNTRYMDCTVNLFQFTLAEFDCLPKRW